MQSPQVWLTHLWQWFEKEAALHPWRKEPRSPYETWVSEVMLQQTTLKSVLPRYVKFLTVFPSVDSLASAPLESVLEQVAGLGYYNRFVRLHESAKIIVKKGWPENSSSWKQLPGIGSYTGAMIGSLLFQEPLLAKDGNVRRILTRMGISPEDEEQLVVENSALSNEALMELGQKICRPRPLCFFCPIEKFCPKKPIPKKKSKELVQVLLNLHIFHWNDGIYIEKRGKNSKFLKESLGFPQEDHGYKGECIGEFSHFITHHKIHVHVHTHHFSSEPNFSYLWTPKENVLNQIFTSMDRKAWDLWKLSRESSRASLVH